jgi:hypothetical protein
MAQKLLKITKPDKTVHVVPLMNKPFYEAQNNRWRLIARPELLWKLEEISESEAKDLPFYDEDHITGAEAVQKNAELQKKNADQAAMIEQLQKQLGQITANQAQANKVQSDASRASNEMSRVPQNAQDNALSRGEVDSRTVGQDTTSDHSASPDRSGQKDEEADLTAPEVIEKIKSATTVGEVRKLVKGDERKTVQDAAEKKITDLKG